MAVAKAVVSFEDMTKLRLENIKRATRELCTHHSFEKKELLEMFNENSIINDELYKKFLEIENRHSS